MVVVTLVPSAGPGVGIVGEVPGVDIVGVLPGVDFVGVKVNTSVVTEMFKLTGKCLRKIIYLLIRAHS